MPLTINTRRGTIRLEGALATLVRRFRREDDGVTAVEFALVSVPFLGLLFAIFETAFVFFAVQGVEAAVNDAARMVMTGQVQYVSGISSAAEFKDKVICNPTRAAQADFTQLHQLQRPGVGCSQGNKFWFGQYGDGFSYEPQRNLLQRIGR